MKIGYARVSTTDQNLDLQFDALIDAGVSRENIYDDKASGRTDNRPGLEACLKALREGDTLLVWKLDRLGRNFRHLINTVRGLEDRGVGFKVLTGQGANIDTTTPNGKLTFGIFAALAEFERELISERTKAGLKSARARGRLGGAKRKISAYALAGVIAKAEQAAIVRDKDFSLAKAAEDLGVHRSTLWRARDQVRKTSSNVQVGICSNAQVQRMDASEPAEGS